MNREAFLALEQEEQENLVFEEVGRCLIHMQHHFKSTSKTDVFHTRLLELLQKEVGTQTKTIALSLQRNGFRLLINPEYFLIDLSTTAERCTVLRYSENHFFLMHPFRQRMWQTTHFDQSSIKLFHICAALENDQFVSGYQKVDGLIQNLKSLELPSRSSAESLFDFLLPFWKDLLALEQEYDNQSRQKLIKKIETKPVLSALYSWKSNLNPIDSSQWLASDVSDIHLQILRSAFDQMIIQVKESLSLKEKKGIENTREQASAKQAYARHNISSVKDELFEKVEQEIDRILIRMTMKDPFYAQFISGCVRQVTCQLPTAGVGFQKDCIVLYINPDFFMNKLRSLEERAAVLKHEALHIILKHLFQMRRSEIEFKDLYNIAADLEVNQYIGYPWILPSSAITLAEYKALNLPKNEVAEVYYNLLLKMKKEDQAQAKQLNQLLDQELNSGKGASDHRGWQAKSESLVPSSEKSNGDGDKAGTNLTTIHEQLSPIDADTFEYEVEKQVQQAVERLSSKDRGKLPGQILSLLEEWNKQRKSKVDWKRELRLFVHSSSKYKRRSTHRKKNKRYVRQFRQLLSKEKLTADALHIITKTKPQLLPALTWQMLTDQHWSCVAHVYPMQYEKIQDCLEQLLDWSCLGRLALHNIYQDFFDDYTWPTWEDLSDKQLLSIKLLRTPLDPNSLPMDLWIMLAKQYPDILPKFSWSLLSSYEIDLIKKQYPALSQIEELAWGIVPNEVIIKCIQAQPKLFQLTWSELPSEFFLRQNTYQLDGKSPYRIDRLIQKKLPGVKKTKLHPKLLLLIDTSGSVTDDDIDVLFTEVNQMYKLGVEVHILQVDTEVQLYYKYSGKHAVAGRGGTEFDPGIEWLNQARHGVDTPIYNSVLKQKEIKKITVKFDGAIYLTDGYAPTPNIKPYCRFMWVLTPDSSDRTIKDWTYTSKVIKLDHDNS